MAKGTELEVADKVFKALQRGRATIPLGDSPPLAAVAGLPWGSTVTVMCEGRSLRVLSGPAACQCGQWVLPVFGVFADSANATEIEFAAVKLRQERGLNLRRSNTSA